MSVDLIGLMPQKPRMLRSRLLRLWGQKEPPVDECRHAHGDDDSRRLAGEELFRHLPGFLILECKAGTKDLFEKRFQERRHRSQPEGIENDEVVRPADGLLRRPLLKVVLRAEDGKLQLSDFDALDLMPSVFGAFGIFVSQCMPIVPH